MWFANVKLLFAGPLMLSTQIDLFCVHINILNIILITWMFSFAVSSSDLESRKCVGQC